MIPLLFVIAVTVATVVLGMVATKRAQSASDFFVAGRQVSVFMNASAISGEYLSAASFMGVAGLLMKNGYDALWYPAGYAVGYLFLLLFIAGPLRRFGAYTIPDFAEGRFDSPLFRRIAVIFVLCIGFFYTMPQMKGAGVTMASIMGWPYWVGVVAVGTVISFNVALGGMKGITFVQAFQYWVKLFAIAVPLFVLMAVYGGYQRTIKGFAEEPGKSPVFTKDTSLSIAGKAKAPANVVAFSAGSETRVVFEADAVLDKVGAVRKAGPGEDPLDMGKAILDDATGLPVGPKVKSGTSATVFPVVVTEQGAPLLKAGSPVRTAPKVEFAEPAKVMFRAGGTVPNSQDNGKWISPFGTLTSKHGYPLLYTFSLIIALICGTAGLPHILVRFYTNPDGRSAKRTTFWVMVLIGVFYFFTPIWGAMGRAFLPELVANNRTDYAVINLPRAIGGVWGDVLSGITSAGAFAAFMSTFSGLLVSMSGAWAHDIYGKILKPESTPMQRVATFKVAAVVFGAVAMGLGLLVESFDIAMLVGWAFAIAAASYFPLLLLGAWWKGLTTAGAASGMLIGGTASLAAIVGSMLSDRKVVPMPEPLVKSLCEQPAIWGVPLAIGTMVLVSKLTRSTVPLDVDLKMLRLHAPEEMGLSRNYIEADH